ncbi:hypothetical protein Hanom_Chr10g00922091 [Helianthus anomalus]
MLGTGHCSPLPFVNSIPIQTELKKHQCFTNLTDPHLINNFNQQCNKSKQSYIIQKHKIYPY